MDAVRRIVAARPSTLSTARASAAPAFWYVQKCSETYLSRKGSEREVTNSTAPSKSSKKRVDESERVKAHNSQCGEQRLAKLERQTVHDC